MLLQLEASREAKTTADADALGSSGPRQVQRETCEGGDRINGVEQPGLETWRHGNASPVTKSKPWFKPGQVL